MANYKRFVVRSSAIAVTNLLIVLTIIAQHLDAANVPPPKWEATRQTVFSKEAAGSSETKIGQAATPQRQTTFNAAGKRGAGAGAAAVAAASASSNGGGGGNLVTHPGSIQAVNRTVNGGNLTSSETQNYYGYEPTTGINKRHVHYPPVPMDVINDDEGTQNEGGEGDDYDNDDVDDSDDYDGDSGEDRGQDAPRQSEDDEGEERDQDDDFDRSASFAVPKIDAVDTAASSTDATTTTHQNNQQGCKTVYKATNNKGVSASVADDDGFDPDFAFKRRRRRSADDLDDYDDDAENEGEGENEGENDGEGGDDDTDSDEPMTGSGSHSTFVISRECHFADDSKSARPSSSAIEASKSLTKTKPEVKSTIPVVAAVAAKGDPIGVASVAARPKVAAGESRFVPINADPWHAPSRGPRDIGFRSNRAGGAVNNRFRGGNIGGRQRKPNAHMSADEKVMKRTHFNDVQNTEQFHKYPYPHFHIYYNRRRATSIPAIGGSSSPSPPPRAYDSADELADPNPHHHHHSGRSSSSEEDDIPYESPNTYFEFTNPNPGGANIEEPNFQSNHHNDDDGDGDAENEGDTESDGDEGGGEGDNGEAESGAPDSDDNEEDDDGEPKDDDRDLSSAPPQDESGDRRTSRKRRSLKDDRRGWTVSGPNFYKSGVTVGDGKSRPKKISYNYYRSDNLNDDLDDYEQPARKQRNNNDGDDNHHNHVRRSNGKNSVRTRRTPSQYNDDQDHDHHHHHSVGRRSQKQKPQHQQHHRHNDNNRRADNDKTQNDDDDYSIHYGSGNSQEYDREYDSAKDPRVNGAHNSDHNGGGHSSDDNGDGGEIGDQDDHGDQDIGGDEEEVDF